MGHPLDKFPGLRVIHSYMIACVIGTELMFHCGLGMFDGNVIKIFATAVFRSPEKHLQVNHVIHDRIMAAKHLHITWPR